MTREQAITDERAARRRHADAELQRGRQRAAARARREKLKVALRETRERFPRCTCELHLDITAEQLRALGAGCAAGRWVCPRLDAVRRRMEGSTW